MNPTYKFEIPRPYPYLECSPSQPPHPCNKIFRKDQAVCRSFDLECRAQRIGLLIILAAIVVPPDFKGGAEAPKKVVTPWKMGQTIKRISHSQPFLAPIQNPEARSKSFFRSL
jgi:hypothetical protein